MYLQEAIQLVKDGKFRKIVGRSRTLGITQGFLCDLSDGSEVSISNISWLTDDSWNVADEVLPEGVKRNEKGNLVKATTVEIWLVFFGSYYNGNIAMASYLEEESAVRSKKNLGDRWIKTVKIEEEVEVPYED